MDQSNSQNPTNNQQAGQFVPPVQTNPATESQPQQSASFQQPSGQPGFQTPQFPGDHEIIKSSQSHAGSYKIIVIIFLVIVLIAAAVYGVIMFKSGAGTNPLTSLNVPPTPVVSAPTSIPTPVVLTQEEQEIDAVDVGNPNAQLQDIDQNVQSL